MNYCVQPPGLVLQRSCFHHSPYLYLYPRLNERRTGREEVMWRRVMVPEESVPFTFLIGVWGEELMTFSERQRKKDWKEYVMVVTSNSPRLYQVSI